jgi:hypothetical protein
MSRTRTVNTRDELENLVDEYVEKGYKVKSSSGEKAVVKERNVGSWVIHLILLIFTIGFGNLVYLLYSWATADTVEINLK